MATQAARTPRQMVRDWMATYAAEHPELVRAEVTAEARRRFLHDDEFVQLVADDMIAREVARVMQATGRVQLGRGRSITRDALTERAATRRGDTWNRWREAYSRVRPDGTVVGLLDMTRTDLIEASADRRDIARDALIGAGFLKGLADQVGDDGETVRDTFQPGDLDDLMRRTEARFTRGVQ